MRTRSTGFPIRLVAQQSTRELETVTEPATTSSDVGSLPVYFIMSHSSYDVEYGEIMRGDTSELHLCDCSSFVAPEGVFVVSATPTGAWGLVCEDPADEDVDNIVRWSGGRLKQWLFSPEGCAPRRMDVLLEGSANIPLIPSFVPEHQKVIDKTHEFFGDPLANSGFGVVKLENGESLSGVVRDGSIGRFGLYTAMSRLPELHALIREAVRMERPVATSEIVRILGRGVYINCACGNINVSVRRERSLECVCVPFAGGREMVVDMYERAFGRVLRDVYIGNESWTAWANRSTTGPVTRSSAGPSVDCTFRRDDLSDYSPTVPRMTVVTRCAAKIVAESMKAFPDSVC